MPTFPPPRSLRPPAARPHEVEPAFLDLRRASQWCGLSVRTLRAAISRGELRSFRPGGKIGPGKRLVAVADLAAWIRHPHAPEAEDVGALVEEVVASLSPITRGEGAHNGT